MTFGSSTNGERTDEAADARRTDDETRTAAAAERSTTATGPKSGAGPEPVHTPGTDGSASADGVKAPVRETTGRETTGRKTTVPETATTSAGPTRGTDRDLGTDRDPGTDRADRTDRTTTTSATSTNTGTRTATDARTDSAHDDRSATANADRTGAVGATRGTDPSGSAGTGTRRDSSATSTPGHDRDGALLAGAGHDELEQRMRHAVSDFVEDPQRAVREAGATFDAVTESLVKALAERSSALRSEEGADGKGERTGERTEQLRIVLQQYRDLTDRLLAV
ncbi:hypothetical protein OG786_30005 [Streptomyces sp. NBC_00101]|uniref:hypothetical protein n=1 Tax=Streptomyces sp. NBC_00101 TaxID=2975651 RepID=UPI00324B9E68